MSSEILVTRATGNIGLVVRLLHTQEYQVKAAARNPKDLSIKKPHSGAGEMGRGGDGVMG